MNFDASDAPTGAALGPYLRTVLREQRENGWAALQGAVITGTIPVPETLLNELLQNAVCPAGPIKSLRLVIEQNNHCVLHVAADKWFLPKHIALGFDVERIIGFPQSPLLRLRLSPSDGVLGGLLDFVLNVVAPLPDTVRVTGKLIEFDLGALLRKNGWGDVIPLIRLLRLRTQTGRIELDFGLAVDEHKATNDDSSNISDKGKARAD